MTASHTPKPDVRRAFLITGTYSSPDAVPASAFCEKAKEAIDDVFGLAISATAYNTPEYLHPFAVDVREQWMKLSDRDRQELGSKHPMLAAALLVFLRGSHEPHRQSASSPVGVGTQDSPALVDQR